MTYYSYVELPNGDIDLINPTGNSRVLIERSQENEIFRMELDRTDDHTPEDISSLVIDLYWYDRSTAWRTGYTEAYHGEDYNNTYTTGSQSWIDYDIGYEEGDHDNA